MNGGVDTTDHSSETPARIEEDVARLLVDNPRDVLTFGERVFACKLQRVSSL